MYTIISVLQVLTNHLALAQKQLPVRSCIAIALTFVLFCFPLSIT